LMPCNAHHMLFVVENRHPAEDCPAGVCRPDWKFAVKLDDRAKDKGLSLEEGYVDPVGHNIFFVVDAEHAQQVFDFITPLLSVGRTRVVPVFKWSGIVDVARRKHKDVR